MEHESALPKEFRFDEYEIVRVLGAGGFGITYLGYDHNLDKPIAIKEYLPSDLAVRKGNTDVVAKSSADRGDFDWGLDRFLTEARVLAQFDHPNIPDVHRFFKLHSTGYMVMEYVEGETLSALYKKRGTLPRAALEKIVLPLLGGLETVHAAGYLHRDIKPDNIVIRDDGSPMLIDFGAARAAIGAKSRGVTAIVTPGYAPIEQYSTKGNHGPWTDIYALAAVLYRGVSGKRPDDAADRILNDELTPLAQSGSSSDKSFFMAIDWALQVREQERPADVVQWRDGLIENKVSPAEHVIYNTKAPEKKQLNRASVFVLPLLVATFAAVIPLGALWWQHDNKEQRDTLDRSAWEKAEKQNTAAAYKEYTSLFSDGTFAELAKIKAQVDLDRSAWEKAEKQNTAEAYKEYASLFPDGNFVKLAKIKAQFDSETMPAAEIDIAPASLKNTNQS